MKLLSQAVGSVFSFLRLIANNSLHQSSKRLGQSYRARDGKIYSVFRETFSDREYNQKEVTLVIGFRLKFIGTTPLFHWLFQRLCILDTPMWCGFAGFKTKFWMVDLKNKDYLGIYQYQGKKNAEVYANYISTILKPLSTKNSVWFEIIESDFEDYLKKTKV